MPYGGDAASFAVYGESKESCIFQDLRISEFGNPQSVKLDTPEKV